jgi:hypothetical protein
MRPGIFGERVNLAAGLMEISARARSKVKFVQHGLRCD